MMRLPQLYNRIIGIPFYQHHAGLFLFIFILLFGIVPGAQLISFHLTLITAMLEAPEFMAMVSMLWFLYGLKCLHFVMKTLQEQHNQFLYLSACLSRAMQLRALVMLQLFIYLPVLLYAVFVVLAGFSSGHVMAASYVILFNGLICLVCGVMYRRKLNRPGPVPRFFMWRFFSVNKAYPLFYISQLLSEMKVIFTVTKFFSAIIIIAFLNGYFIDSYDGRVVMLGFLISLTAHCVMIFEFRKFEESFLGFYRNLPVHPVMRWCHLAWLYLMILTPEWLIFASAIPDRVQPADLWWLPLFGTFLLLCFHCLLYKPPLNMERYLQWVFGIFAVLFFLMLYHLFLPAILLLAGGSLFYFFRWYHRFEPVNGQL